MGFHAGRNAFTPKQVSIATTGSGVVCGCGECCFTVYSNVLDNTMPTRLFAWSYKSGMLECPSLNFVPVIFDRPLFKPSCYKSSISILCLNPILGTHVLYNLPLQCLSPCCCFCMNKPFFFKTFKVSYFRQLYQSFCSTKRTS